MGYMKTLDEIINNERMKEVENALNATDGL